MYVVPILALAILLAIGAAWSPIFAVIIAVPLFLIFLAYVGFTRRADQTERPSSGAPASGEGQDAGIWGEERPGSSSS